MKNEEAKQRAIRRAYYDAGYKELLPLNVNGWIKVKPTQYLDNLFERLKINKEIHSIRLKSLKKLDTNNGWTRIEPDGSNLPTDNTIYYKCGKMFEDGEFIIDEMFIYKHKDIDKNKYTHFKPVEQDLPPIY